MTPYVEEFLWGLVEDSERGRYNDIRARGAWESAINALEARGVVPPDLVADLRASEIPQQAMYVVNVQHAAADQFGFSRADARNGMQVSLGLVDPEGVPLPDDRGMYDGAEEGRFVAADFTTGDDFSASWSGEVESDVRTRATAEFGEEMIADLRRSGYTHKRWITREDPRVRPEHAAVDGATIPVDDMFIVGGSPMRYPADPTAPPSLICNCRCVLIGVTYDVDDGDDDDWDDDW